MATLETIANDYIEGRISDLEMFNRIMESDFSPSKKLPALDAARKAKVEFDKITIALPNARPVDEIAPRPWHVVVEHDGTQSICDSKGRFIDFDNGGPDIYHVVKCVNAYEGGADAIR